MSKPMNVWQHLGEIRRRLIYCIYVLLGGTLIAAFFVNSIVSWIALPAGTLVFIHPTEAFTAQVKVAVGASFLVGLPFFLYQGWAFLATGLKEKEKRYIRWAMPLSYFLFLAGTSFGVFFVFPRAVDFLLTLKSEHLSPMLSVEPYLDFFGLLGLAFGLLFQLPLVLHFLAKMGVMRPQFLEGNRRICYLLIFVLATLFNPVPEVFTQLLLAFSAIALFETSIVLVRWETKKTQKISV
jgi:sec-independent protein translocase protein TatC